MVYFIFPYLPEFIFRYLMNVFVILLIIVAIFITNENVTVFTENFIKSRNMVMKSCEIIKHP